MNHEPAAWIGLVNPKSPTNVGSVLRAAGCFGASGVFYTGYRFHHARQFVSDTQDNHERIPLELCDALLDVLPEGAVPVAIELVEGATPLMQFKHPPRAFYLFGPEDSSLDKTLVNACEHVVYIPTTGCLNLAATVNVVLYDRMAKLATADLSNELIRRSRDTNNRLKI